MAQDRRGESFELSEEIKNKCVISYTPNRPDDSREEMMIDCRSVSDGPLAGALYKKHLKASIANGDAVFTCIEGCRASTVRKIWYMPIESGC